MERQRDSQRSKVYASERIAWAKYEDKRAQAKFDGVQDAQKYVDRIMASKWFQTNYPDLKRITVHLYAGQSMSYCRMWTRNAADIHLAEGWGFTAKVLVHELAHALSKSKFGMDIAGHGREFAKVYIRLTRRQFGAEAAIALRESFKEGKVKKTVARKPRKPMTEEQREAARARLAAARAARTAKVAADPTKVLVAFAREQKRERGWVHPQWQAEVCIPREGALTLEDATGDDWWGKTWPHPVGNHRALQPGEVFLLRWASRGVHYTSTRPVVCEIDADGKPRVVKMAG